MKRLEVENWLVRHGYSRDKYGYWKNPNKPGYRFKLSRVMLTRQYHQKFEGGGSVWQKITSGYIKDLKLNKKDQISGLRYNLPAVNSTINSARK